MFIHPNRKIYLKKSYLCSTSLFGNIGRPVETIVALEIIDTKPIERKAIAIEQSEKAFGGTGVIHCLEGHTHLVGMSIIAREACTVS